MGIVAARKCPLCGHHEIGFTTSDEELLKEQEELTLEEFLALL
jgi:dihydrodipicolinate reductase